MKKFLILFSLILTINTYSQDLSQYKYVVVPEQFSFLKEADQYQLNSLTKFLFEKYGFETYIEGEEAYVKLSPDRCEGLYADVLNDSGLFRTKLQITLKDCRNQQVFKSREGESRQKDYGTAYQAALREAFKSIEELDYLNNEIIVSSTPDLKERKAVNEQVDEDSSIEEEPKTVQVPDNKKESKTESTAAGEKSLNKNLPQNTIEKTTEIKVSNTSTIADGLNFTREGRNYFLKKTENGFNMFQEGMTEPFASLISSSTGDKFVYSSLTSKGMAQRDGAGNLIIEILRANDSLETIIYKARVQ